MRSDLGRDECSGTQGIFFSTSMADIVDAVAENFCVIVIFREVFGTNLLLGRLGSSGHLGSQQDVIIGFSLADFPCPSGLSENPRMT